MANRALAPTALFALFGLSFGVATCTFPDITFAPEDTGAMGGSGGTDKGGAGAGGSGGITSSTNSTGSTNATGGSGGSPSTSTGTPTCPLDFDGDGAVSWQCEGGTDCADKDPNTHPDIIEYSATPIQNEAAMGTLAYDKNCDGAEEAEIPVLGCNFGDCASKPLGFKAAVPCGMSAALGHCKSVAIFACEWQAENPTVMVVQKCK